MTGVEDKNMPAYRPCKLCGKPVVRNAAHYDDCEGMHWICFHLMFEHVGDADAPCENPRCPWRQIVNLIANQGADPNFILQVIP